MICQVKFSAESERAELGAMAKRLALLGWGCSNFRSALESNKYVAGAEEDFLT